MADMDWPIAEDPLTSSADGGVRPKEKALPTFRKTKGASGRLHIAKPREVPRIRLWPTRRFISRRAGLLLGAGAVGVLLFGSVARMREESGTSVTQPLPQAANPSNIVINLPPPNLLKPISPEEAVKENAERPFVGRPDTPASRFVLRTAAEDHERALNCLTQAVYYEAAGEGVDGGRAVAQVVLNRMRHPGYPASVCGVIYQGADRPYGCQFTFTCDGSLLRSPVASLWARSRKIAEGALAGKVFAPIGHATHYHADYVLPYWADSLDKTVQIGRHIFYRLRSALGDSRSFFQPYAGAEPPLPQPTGAVVLDPTTATDQLASALISDALKDSTPDVEKAAPAASALIADAAPATLVADQLGAVGPAKKKKAASDCSVGAESRKLTPLRSTDMRALAIAPGC